jgi:CRISPR-associated endonuclease/helicase Cas3
VCSSDLAHLVILEAETGSGKTEAALWHYMRLFEAGRVDGLYFAVPTRAAAAQLHGRVCKAMRRLFGAADPQPVLAVPGYLRAGTAEGEMLPHWQVRWDDAGDADEARLSARWAAEHAKRYLAAQVAVGTVDQAMLGTLMVKHAHLRAASLARSLLVIDEVHASDAYMTAVQKRLLDAHRGIGGYAMLMSATLGSVARAKWLDQPQPDLTTAAATPYPAVWTERGPAPRCPDEPPLRPKQVVMEALGSMSAEATAIRALEAARRGARVLVIRNTVERAIATLAALEASAGPEDRKLLFAVEDVVTLHHSRFGPADRRRLDAAVEACLSTDKMRQCGGKIVVGSQTLEQSLDIDADLLITDLCPVDVLLQRIGRLHRHTLPRPRGFEQPRCVVMTPETGLEPLLAPAFDNGLGAWRGADGTLNGIYTNLSGLELTRRLVATGPLWSIPLMNRQLVEAATHPEALRRLHAEPGSGWKAYHDKVIAAELAESHLAQFVLLDRTKPFEGLVFPGDEERIRTRLGEEGARLRFGEPVPLGPFGAQVDEIVLPAHWSVALPVDVAPEVRTTTEKSFIFTLAGRSFIYDRFGLRRKGIFDEPADGAVDPL